MGGFMSSLPHSIHAQAEWRGWFAALTCRLWEQEDSLSLSDPSRALPEQRAKLNPKSDCHAPSIRQNFAAPPHCKATHSWGQVHTTPGQAVVAV